MSVRFPSPSGSPAAGDGGADVEPWPSVSVVIPTRDRPGFLARAVRAVLDQRYDGEIECIVVFDQSEPFAIPVNCGPRRSVRSIVNARTPGLAGARNSGSMEATGEYLAPCDDDDIWLPDKLRLQIEAMRRDPRAIAAACGVRIRYGASETVRLPKSSAITFRHLLASRVVELNSSTLLTRRDAFLGSVGPIDESLPGSYAEDYEWLLRAGRLGPIVVVPFPLVEIRWHRGSHFEGRWDTMAAALTQLLEQTPEFEQVPRGLARIQGQVAFALAASGRMDEARSWIRCAMSNNRLEPRAYLARAVTLGLPAQTIVRVLHRHGRGV